MQITSVTAALEIRLQTGALAVQHSEALETVEDAILWLRRETKKLKAVGLAVEARRYTIDGRKTWLAA